MKNSNISFSEFCDGFKGGISQDKFSYKGLQALYDYLTEYEESTGEEIEFDPIALCVEYTEYETFEEFQENYSMVETIEKLEDKTQVIKIEGTDGFIIQNY